MTKPELAEAVASKAKLKKVQAGQAVDAVFNAIRDSLRKGQKVQIVGFGTFEVRKRGARQGRNPRTQQTIKIPATRIPGFRAGKQLKSAVAK